ncbi:MAG: Inner membrane protein, KefB/KefC family, partial [uncultured Sphingomonadaceae bacterium]
GGNPPHPGRAGARDPAAGARRRRGDRVARGRAEPDRRLSCARHGASRGRAGDVLRRRHDQHPGGARRRLPSVRHRPSLLACPYPRACRRHLRLRPGADAGGDDRARPPRARVRAEPGRRVPRWRDAGPVLDRGGRRDHRRAASAELPRRADGDRDPDLPGRGGDLPADRRGRAGDAAGAGARARRRARQGGGGVRRRGRPRPVRCAAAVRDDRAQPKRGSVHRNRAAGRARRRLGDGRERAVDDAGRIPRRHDRRRNALPRDRAVGGQAVPRPVPGLLLHLRRPVDRRRDAGALLAGGDRRGRAARDGEDRRQRRRQPVLPLVGAGIDAVELPARARVGARIPDPQPRLGSRAGRGGGERGADRSGRAQPRRDADAGGGGPLAGGTHAHAQGAAVRPGTAAAGRRRARVHRGNGHGGTDARRRADRVRHRLFRDRARRDAAAPGDRGRLRRRLRGPRQSGNVGARRVASPPVERADRAGVRGVARAGDLGLRTLPGADADRAGAERAAGRAIPLHRRAPGDRTRHAPGPRPRDAGAAAARRRSGSRRGMARRGKAEGVGARRAGRV